MEDLKKFIEEQSERTNNSIMSMHTAIKNDIQQTNDKIDSIQATINTEIVKIQTDLLDHTNRIVKVESEMKSNEAETGKLIADLSLEIEHLKQDRLRNNIRVTGLPQHAFDDPDDAILRIDHILQTGLIPSDWTAHADRFQSSLIVAFSSYAIKRFFMDQMRKKQTLFAEEMYNTIKSNSRIYINDQLTPYYAKLFQLALKEKKAGTIFSASSLGGRVRVRKFENGPSRVVDTDQQLINIIDSEQLPPAPPNNQPQSSQSSTDTQQNDKMETTPSKNESQQSQQQDVNNIDTPKSFNSAEARKSREKSFTHNRPHSNASQPSRRLPLNRFARPPNRFSNNHPQRDLEYPQPYGQKRNNRHITSLEHKNQQPTDKRRLSTTKPSPEYQYQYTRDRDYQNKLRSFVK